MDFDREDAAEVVPVVFESNTDETQAGSEVELGEASFIHRRIYTPYRVLEDRIMTTLRGLLWTSIMTRTTQKLSP